jgi:hypothetical protein
MTEQRHIRKSMQHRKHMNHHEPNMLWQFGGVDTSAFVPY